jgi:hypothetical protein
MRKGAVFYQFGTFCLSAITKKGKHDPLWHGFTGAAILEVGGNAMIRKHRQKRGVPLSFMA